MSAGSFLDVFDKLAAGALSPEVEAQCKQARAAIAELIAADREYDAANALTAGRDPFSLTIKEISDAFRRIDSAKQRRAAALAAVGGEVQG